LWYIISKKKRNKRNFHQICFKLLLSYCLSCIKMPFNNIPVRNPGRYFEQFVKVVQPVGGSSNMSSMQNTPSMAITSSYMTGNTGNQNNKSSQSFGSYGNQQQQQPQQQQQQQQVTQFKWATASCWKKIWQIKIGQKNAPISNLTWNRKQSKVKWKK